MRPEFDGEIDSVLRGHARRGGASPVAWEGGLRPSISGEGASGSHLDADEIAAFGEGALPQAARARYATHLADCDDCRRSVTQVTLAAGVADRIEERERVGASAAAAAATQSPSWRERLAAVFSPRAWRYAMPVVALLAVGTVVFVVMRGPLRDGGMETASKRDSASQQTAAPAAPESHHAGAKQQQAEQSGTQTGNAATAEVAPQAAGGEAPDRAEDELAKLRAKSVDGAGQPPAGGAAGTLGAGPTVAQPVQAAPPQPVTESYTITSATPSPAPPLAASAPAPRQMVLRDVVPQPTPAPAHEHAEPEAKERARASSRAAVAARDEAPATKRHGPQRSGAGRGAELSSAADASKDDQAASRTARRPLKNEANRNDADERKAEREEARGQQAETRSVGGRRFRRDGGVWIDTAYRSSQATVVVRRNSEQYRALVADVPEIDRISRSLGGEAVIVWKGRAYRIKP